MLNFPIKEVNFEKFMRNINGKEALSEVDFIEFFIDSEVKEFIVKNYLNKKYIRIPFINIERNNINAKVNYINSNELSEITDRYYKQEIDLLYNLGYCIYNYIETSMIFRELFVDISIKSNDTAILSRGKRNWAQEGLGIIKTWKDFEEFPWKKLEHLFDISDKQLDIVSKNLREGMKISFNFTLFEFVLEYLLGFEGLFIKIHDDPELVENIFQKLGNFVERLYKLALSKENVEIIWHSDDIGFKTATLISKKDLNRYFFPWFKKFSNLIHNHNKMLWYHSCGHKYEVMEDLIEDIKIDAIHSFEDTCSPVIDYKKKYGDRIALLGGVDMNKLVTLSEDNLRKYIRKILKECISGGRFALGSGNTVSNYVPVENYLIMLEEGLNWKGN